MIVEKLGMTVKVQGRAGSVQLWLDSWKRLKVCRHVWTIGAMIVGKLGRRDGKAESSCSWTRGKG